MLCIQKLKRSKSEQPLQVFLITKKIKNFDLLQTLSKPTSQIKSNTKRKNNARLTRGNQMKTKTKT